MKDLQQQTLSEGAGGVEQLQKLVQALAQGAQMDWLAWHQGASWHQLRPPGHPFLRSRFWWTPRDQGLDQGKASLWLDHLGVGSGVTTDQPVMAFQKLDLPGVSEHWQTVLDPADARDLQDHALHGYPLFAAAGYLALVLDWLNDQQQPLQCADLNLDRPLWLNAGSVQLQAVRDGDAFSFHARAPQVEDAGSWQLHGQLRLTTAPEQPIQPLQDLVFDGGADLDISNFYRSLKSLGLDYGRCYRPLAALQANAKSAEALLHRPDGAPDRSLIDGCFQLVAAVLAQTHADGQLLLPVGVEQMQMLRWPLPDQLRCRLQLRSEDQNQGAEGSRAHVTADLDFLDLSGDLLGGIRGLQLRRLTRTLLELMLPEAPSSPAGQLLEDIWQPLAAHALSDWSPGAAEPITLIAFGPLPDAVKAWCDQQAIAPFELDAQGDPQSVTSALVQQLQALPLSQPRQVVLWMSAFVTPAAGAVQAAMRSLAQDCSAWRCSTITASASALVGGLSQAQWQQLLAATAGDAEVCWCGSDCIETRSFQPIDQERFRMLSDGSGRLEGLLKAPLPLARLQPGELELAVEATGLNFRDVLNALGLLQSHNQFLGLRANAQLPFGGEAVGRVVAVGPGVDSSLVGQRMLAALTLGSLAS
ncbi:MAG: polyketide synthase dehydratase domain-containing protein, partial [Prochlorococcus sp.]